MWTRRLTWPGERDDDWLVYRDGELMGRVHMTVLCNPSRDAWVWFKQWGHGAKGEAETLEQACNALRDFCIQHGQWHANP